MSYLAFFHGRSLSLLFTTDLSVAAASADYLKAYAFDCILTSFLFCFIGYFNGRGWTRFVMVQGIAGSFGVRIPVSAIVSHRVGVTLFQVGLATPASDFVQIVLCLVRFAVGRRNDKTSVLH
jgi:Na+-driven multidrug efflux pump